MSYNRLNWVEGETPLSAQNFNNIEDGVEEALNGLEALGTRAALFNAIYPVGSIYMSVNNTNPSALFGGTWVAWGSGRVPVGVNTSDSSFNTVEKTGGSATHTHTNPSTGSTTLTVNQIPAHSHYMNTKGSVVVNVGSSKTVPMLTLESNGFTTRSTGGGQSHNHTMGNTGISSTLQPYITCYMWKRTA